MGTVAFFVFFFRNGSGRDQVVFFVPYDVKVVQPFDGLRFRAKYLKEGVAALEPHPILKQSRVLKIFGH